MKGKVAVHRSSPSPAAVRACAGFGDFWSLMLLAEGAVEIVVEPLAAVWDQAPLQVMVEEAGGRFTDLNGKRNDQPEASAVATNGCYTRACWRRCGGRVAPTLDGIGERNRTAARFRFLSSGKCPTAPGALAPPL